MKNKLVLLLKTYLIDKFKLRKLTKKKLIGVSLLVIYIIASLFITLGLFLTNLFNTLNEVGMTDYYITILFAMSSLFAFAFTIFSAKASLFDNKDNDLLLSLPVKRSDILASRLLILTGTNFLMGLLFIIPGVIIYAKVIALTPIYIVSIVLLTLFFAIIPTILSSLFGYLVAILTSKTNSKSMFELLFYILFIALYMFAISSGNMIIVSLVSNPNTLNMILKTLFLPIYLMHKGLITGNILYILGFIITNLVCLFLFIFIFNKSYLGIISKLSSHKSKSNYKLKTLRTQSVGKALFKKELSRYFSSAIYVFNTLFGIVFIAIGGIASLIYSPEKLIALIDMGEMSQFMLVFMLTLFVISLTDTTNSSISIERENFWILKMIPVNTKDIFKAKINVNRLVAIPVTVISLFLFNLSGYINVIEFILLSVFVIIYACFIANFGLISNLLFPNFNAVNDAVIVKQSAASFMGIFGGLAFFGVFIGINSLFSLTNTNSLFIAIGLGTIFLIASTVVLNKWGVKRFREIN